MRKPLPTLVLLALAALAVLPACSKSPMWPARPSIAEPPGPIYGDASGLVVHAEVSDAEIAPGEAMSVKVVVENPTDRDVILTFSSGCYITFAVTTTDGVAVAPRYWICTTDVPIVTFAAHGSVVREYPWSGYDALGPDERYGSPLPAGEYLVVGVLGDRAVAASEPVPIRIVEP